MIPRGAGAPACYLLPLCGAGALACQAFFFYLAAEGGRATEKLP